MSEDEVIGLAIRRVRQRRRLTQQQVEVRGKLGVGTLSGLEQGRRHPHWGTIRKAANGIGVHPKVVMEEVEKIERMEAEG